MRHWTPSVTRQAIYRLSHIWGRSLKIWHSDLTHLHTHLKPSHSAQCLCPLYPSQHHQPCPSYQWGRHPEPEPHPLPQTQQAPQVQCQRPTHSLTRSSELQPLLSQSLPRCKAPAIPFSLPFSFPPPSSPNNTSRPHSEQGGWSTQGPLQQSCCFSPP